MFQDGSSESLQPTITRRFSRARTLRRRRPALLTCLRFPRTHSRKNLARKSTSPSYRDFHMTPGGVTKETIHFPMLHSGLSSEIRPTFRTDVLARFNPTVDLYPRSAQVSHASLPASSGTLNSLSKVLCTFPSRYLSTIRLERILRLRWSIPPG